MLTSEQDVAISEDGDPRDGARAARRRVRTRAATGFGVVGFVLAVLFPFLPVVEHTATIDWPSPVTGTAPVNAPLVALRPESMTATVPCAAVRSLDERTLGAATVFATVPPASAPGTRSGMSLTVTDGLLRLVNRGVTVLEEPVPPGDCALAITSDGASTTVDLGAPQTFEGDQRPQVVGIYSDLDGVLDPIAGTEIAISPDTRYDTSPTTLKYGAGALVVLCLVGALVALWRIDAVHGRRPHRPADRS